MGKNDNDDDVESKSSEKNKNLPQSTPDDLTFMPKFKSAIDK